MGPKMNQTTNPLKHYFRQPVVYLRLPSDGQFWPMGSLDMPPNRELPVLPMTAMDEISYRTPDALFNGTAVVDVIQSCVPNIKNAWKVPSMDLNAILVAIRIASYGDTLELQTQCPKCNEISDFGLDLNAVQSSIPQPNYSASVAAGDLEVYFKPIDYEQQNTINALQFEQQKVIQMLPTSELPEEEKVKRINDALTALTQLTVQVMKNSIAAIKTPEAVVSESEFIDEFLLNCDRRLFNSIRDKAIELRESSEIPPMKAQCPHCQHDYEQPISLDSTNFFGLAS